MGLGPTQGDEKRLLFSNYSPWKRRPSLCHLDRSAAQVERSLCGYSFLEMFFRQCEVQWRDLRFPFPHIKRYVATSSYGRIISLSSCSRMWQCHT